MTQSRFKPARPTLLAALLALTGFLAACGGDDDTEAGAEAQEALPTWIVSVRPEPGAENSTLRLVQVQHQVQTGGQSVRLLIDGVDVTNEANFGSEERVTGPGHILFDPDHPEAANAPVDLDPGEHTATVELVELEEIGGSEEVVDSFTWSFSIQ